MGNNNRISFDPTQVSKSITKVSNLLENVGSAAQVFKGHVDGVYDRSKLIFVKTISTQLDELIVDNKKLVAITDNVRVGLARYADEVATFSRDTRGLK